MLIAVGNASFDDCERFTSSFGWIGFFDPIAPPAISIARFEMTSFTFMFVCVPLPVCQTTSGKWSSSFPSMTSWAAFTIRSRLSGGKSFRSVFTCAAACLIDGERADDLDRHPLAADLEVLERALGLGAPVAVGGDRDLAHRVGFDAGLHRVRS